MIINYRTLNVEYIHAELYWTCSINDFWLMTNSALAINSIHDENISILLSYHTIFLSYKWWVWRRIPNDQPPVIGWYILCCFNSEWQHHFQWIKSMVFFVIVCFWTLFFIQFNLFCICMYNVLIALCLLSMGIGHRPYIIHWACIGHIKTNERNFPRSVAWANFKCIWRNRKWKSLVRSAQAAECCSELEIHCQTPTANVDTTDGHDRPIYLLEFFI